MSIPVHFIVEVSREIYKRVFNSLLGESVCEASLFFLYRRLGRDPFEVLWDDPKTFYRELERIFKVGAKVLIKLLVSRINSEFGLNMDPEHFLELMQRGDQISVEKIRLFLKRVAELYEGKDETYNKASILQPS
ncbi:MAG: hypothetical protein QXI56_00540 [Candidatus Bathyarchaeia archaeon]